MKFRTLVMIAALAVSVSALAGGEARRYIEHDGSRDATALPFSDAVLVGDTLYVAGHLGIDPKTGQAAQDPQAEAKLVMDSVEHTVKSAGLTMDDLVSVTVYCTDLGLYEVFNTTYRSYFHGKHPARAFVGVAKLLRGAHFEVQGLAVNSRP